MLQNLKQIQGTPRDWRWFGWLIGVVLCLIGLWLARRPAPFHPWFWGSGLIIVFLGQFLPKVLRWPYKIWMGIGLVLGAIVSSIFLTVFFYLILTPLGLLARWRGHDFLQRRCKPEATSFWQPRKNASDRKPENYERQF